MRSVSYHDRRQAAKPCVSHRVSRETPSGPQVPRAKKTGDACAWRFQLGVDFQPSKYSVICGRGKVSYGHTGNHRLRKLASKFVENYSVTDCKQHRSTIASHVVAMTPRRVDVFASTNRVHGSKLEMSLRAKRSVLCSVTCCIPNTDHPPRPRLPVVGFK
jgi:hypothetical protein